MGSEANSTAVLLPESATPAAEELISRLRSSFFSIEFENVTKMLKEREEYMKQKYFKLEKQAEEEKGLLRSENLKLMDEFKKKQKEVDELRKENMEFKDQIKVLNSEKCKASKNLGLEDELKKKQSEIDATRKENAELERKVRAYEKRCLDFEVRVSSLEKIAKELMDSGSFFIDLEIKQHKNSAHEISRPPGFSKRKDSSKRTEPKVQETILIDDDDEEEEEEEEKDILTLKRKRVSNEIKRESNIDDDDLKVIPVLKRPRVSKEIKREHDGEHELHNRSIASPPVSTPQSAIIPPFLENIEPKNFISTLDSSDSSSGSDDEEVNEAWMSSANLMKEKERWKDEADLVKDLEKDDELCMNGICALQRRKIIVHGSDTSRIANLARMLINGDQEGKLTKTALELNVGDLHHCRIFARKYSLQLFNIYQEKSDPFFPPRS